MSIVRLCLTLVVWWFAVSWAATYGSIWESQVHPLQGVTLQFADGTSATGNLSRNFDQSWNLSATDGSTRQFKQSDWVVMTTTPRTGQSFGDMWRSWLPVVLVSAAAVTLMGWPWLSRFFRRSAAEK